MNEAKWRRAQEIFKAAVERPVVERGRLLDEACGDDGELRREVDSLLAHDRHAAHDFLQPLERPARLHATAPSNACRSRDRGAASTGDDAALASDGFDPLIGRRVGEFTIRRVIAAGGMGTVYEAEQDQPRRLVALKMMRRYVASRSALRRFQFEAEILGKLRHPNIAQVYAAGMYDGEVREETRRASGKQQDRDGIRDTTLPPGVPYFAMEYIPDARTITQFAESRGLDVRARLRLLLKVYDAVQHGHQNGVIHRDLKPGNILVDAAGEPKIIDFGVARATDSDIARTTMHTGFGQIVGTLAYMSPEQVEGDSPNIDTRCDVYALGVVGYELLCGRLPVDVDGKTLHAAIHAILNFPVKPLAAHDRRLRGDLSRVIAKAVEKDKNLRYGSADAFAEDLLNVLEHRPIMARPPGPFYVLAKLARRHSLVVAALCLGAFFAAAGLVRAQMARNTLHAHYLETRDVAAFLARDLADKLDEVGGTNAIRRDLLQRLRGQVENLLDLAPGDRKLLTAYSDVLQNLSNVELAEGNFDVAWNLRQKVLELCRQQAADRPDELEAQADLSIALVLVGDVHQQRGDLAEARRLFQEALAIDETLARRHPESRRCQSNLLWSYIRLTQINGHQGFTAAEQWSSLALQKQAEMLARDPDDADAIHAGICLAVALYDLAAGPDRRFIKTQNAREFLSLARRLQALAPDNYWYQRNCVRALLGSGNHARENTDFDAAEELLAEAGAFADRLLKLEPQELEHHSLRTGVLKARSKLALARGDLQTAATLAAESCEVAAHIVEQNPELVLSVRHLIYADMYYASVLSTLDREVDARRYYQRAADACRRLARDQRLNPNDAISYAQLLFGMPIADLRDPDTACETARRILRETDGQFVPAWELLVQYHQQRGENDRVKECYERILSLLPAEDELRRGRIRQALDRLAAAALSD